MTANEIRSDVRSRLAPLMQSRKAKATVRSLDVWLKTILDRHPDMPFLVFADGEGVGAIPMVPPESDSMQKDRQGRRASIGGVQRAAIRLSGSTSMKIALHFDGDSVKQVSLRKAGAIVNEYVGESLDLWNEQERTRKGAFKASTGILLDFERTEKAVTAWLVRFAPPEAQFVEPGWRAAPSRWNRVAQGWAARGFEADAVAGWIGKARCFSSASAAKLRDASVTPDRAAVFTREGRGKPETVGCKFSHGQLSLADAVRIAGVEPQRDRGVSEYMPAASSETLAGGPAL